MALTPRLEIKQSTSKKNDLPQVVMPIKNVLDDRFAVCYRVYAQFEYQKYCEDRDEKHLIIIRSCIFVLQRRN